MAKKIIQILPEGAISLEQVEKIHLQRLLDAGGMGDLAPVLGTFAQGLVLEEEGKLKDAAKLYKATLKRNPNSGWIKEALARVKYTLN